MTNEIVLYQPDDQLSLEVKVENDTVWLNRNQMAVLFDRDVKTIGKHINNALHEELAPVVAKFAPTQKANPVIAKFATTASDGKVYQVEYYNLDVILSVGYRVKSSRGIEFRRWSNRILNEYVLKGYAVNQRILAVEERIDRCLHEHTTQILELQNKVDFFVRTNVPPVEQVFYNGEFFEARVLLEKLIKTAKNRVIIIDGYIDAATFEILNVRMKGVTADIYSDGLHKTLRDSYNLSSGLQPVDTHKWSNPSHDRWLIIDDRVYHCGPSLKDMGQKLGAVSLLSIDANDILKIVK